MYSQRPHKTFLDHGSIIGSRSSFLELVARDICWRSLPLTVATLVEGRALKAKQHPTLTAGTAVGFISSRRYRTSSTDFTTRVEGRQLDCPRNKSAEGTRSRGDRTRLIRKTWTARHRNRSRFDLRNRAYLELRCCCYPQHPWTALPRRSRSLPPSR